MDDSNQPGAIDSFGFLFKSTSDAVLLVDPRDGQIVDANETASGFLGYGREELKALTAEDLHPHELEDFRAFASRVERERTCRTDELACRCKSGQLVPADISAALVHIRGRDAMLVILRNLRRERLAEVGMSVAKIGHDLRNILASGRLLAERLEVVEDPKTRRIAVDVVATVDRAVEMCTATLSAGRAEEPAPRFETMNLRSLVETVALTASLDEAGAPDWLNDVPEEIEVTADRRQLHRVLTNLVRNAVQATSVDGLVAFHACTGEDGVRLDVSDTGPGLPDGLRENPFSAFARSSAAGGTGLGLTIAHELMLNQGGTLELVRTGSEGTTFRLTMLRP